jgi:hypothetical protein
MGKESAAREGACATGKASKTRRAIAENLRSMQPA